MPNIKFLKNKHYRETVRFVPELIENEEILTLENYEEFINSIFEKPISEKHRLIEKLEFSNAPFSIKNDINKNNKIDAQAV